jgi:hypothetical protein
MMVDTDDSGDLPCAIFLPPDVDELCLADNAVVLLPWMKESVDADLDCAVALQGINFQRSGYQLALYLSAKIILDRINDLWTAHHEAIFVVVEFCIGPKRRLGFHVTAVDGIEKLLIELRDGLKELVRGGDLVAGRGGMSGIRLGDGPNRQGNQSDDHKTSSESGFQTVLLGIEWSDVR